MSWFEEIKKTSKKNNPKFKRSELLWKKCPGCNKVIQEKDLEENFYSCGHCGFNFKIPIDVWIKTLSDDETKFQESNRSLITKDPLKFFDIKSYEKRVQNAYEKTGSLESVITGRTTLENIDYSLIIFESEFMSGSIGVATAEKISKAIELAISESFNVVLVYSSAGPRIQEGIFSVFQLPKILFLISELKSKGLSFITILTHSNMLKNVTYKENNSIIEASDIVLAEKNIEFLNADKIVTRRYLKQDIGYLLKIASGNRK